MSPRATQLHAVADQQVSDLLGLVSRQTPETLQRPCPGRQKLGDGTVGALIAHTADNYERIAGFASGQDVLATDHVPPTGGHTLPRFLRALGHTRPEHGGNYTAQPAEPQALRDQLDGIHASLAQVADLTDDQLDAVPAEGSFRFCDGKRTFEEVLRALLKHQARQLDTIRSAGG
jgi:hypothetical protein